MIKYIAQSNNEYLALKDNQYYITTKLSEAKTFESRKSFENILKTNVSPTLKQDKEWKAQIVLGKRDTGLSKVHNTYMNGLYKEIKDYCNRCNNKSEVEKKIKNKEKEILDIYHYIEFNGTNSKEDVLLVNKLRDILKERREYKNELECIEALNSCCDSEEEMEKIIDNKIQIYNALAKTKNREYKPRLLKNVL